MELTTNT